ncbi:MAG: peptide/nickel transport system ATP-binding protein, partial [Solirubrobacteraceae bacterium]
MTDPTLEVRDLRMHFPLSGRLGRAGAVVHAVDGVSFTVAPGEVVGLVGESGSGKSTVGNCILRLLEPTEGTISLKGTDITHLSRRELRPLRREMHMVFQDPYSSLNPRMTNGAAVGEPLRLHGLAGGDELEARIAELFDEVGLNPDLRHRYPHELSGGQRQRICLARALSVRPGLLVADEPVSALDVSVQAAILNLLADLQQDLGFACLFITHDLSIVEYFCD